MSKSISVIPKKRGRPATGRDPLIGVRFHADLLHQVEQWAERKNIGRSQAVREICIRGIGPDKYINYILNDHLPKETMKSQLASDILSVLNQHKSVFVTNETLNYSIANPENFSEIDAFAKNSLHAQWVEYEHYAGDPTNPSAPITKGIIFYRQE